MTSIKILVADDHAIVREGLKALLELEDDMEVIHEAASSMECLTALDHYRPDVILMDLKMPGIGGIAATRLIKQRHPQIKIILLTNYDDEEYVLEAIRAEVDGYVLKDVNKGDLVKIVRLVIEGHAFIDSSVTPKVLRYLKKAGLPTKQDPQATLSQRELEILEGVVEGKSNQEIANTACISVDTVKSHLKNIYHKLGVSNRSQAVKTAIKDSLVYLSR